MLEQPKKVNLYRLSPSLLSEIKKLAAVDARRTLTEDTMMIVTVLLQLGLRRSVRMSIKNEGDKSPYQFEAGEIWLSTTIFNALCEKMGILPDKFDQQIDYLNQTFDLPVGASDLLDRYEGDELKKAIDMSRRSAGNILGIRPKQR